MAKVFVGRVTKDSATREFTDKNGVIKYGVTVAENLKDGTANFYDFTIQSEKLASYLTKGKRIAVAYDSIFEKISKGKDGKTYTTKYLNGAALSFIPEKKEEEQAERKTLTVTDLEETEDDQMPF